MLLPILRLRVESWWWRWCWEWWWDGVEGMLRDSFKELLFDCKIKENTLFKLFIFRLTFIIRPILLIDTVCIIHPLVTLCYLHSNLACVYNANKRFILHVRLHVSLTLIFVHFLLTIVEADDCCLFSLGQPPIVAFSHWYLSFIRFNFVTPSPSLITISSLVYNQYLTLNLTLICKHFFAYHSWSRWLLPVQFRPTTHCSLLPLVFIQ